MEDLEDLEVTEDLVISVEIRKTEATELLKEIMKILTTESLVDL